MKRRFEKLDALDQPHVHDHRTSSELSLAHMQTFDLAFPVFQLPKCVGYFSLDEERKYQSDASQLRYLNLPRDKTASHLWRVCYNLRNGLEKVIMKSQKQIKDHMLDDMLTWILNERRARHSYVVNVDSPLRPLEIEFVCFRGLLTLVMTTPYENRESWSIVATKFQNSIYLWHLKANPFHEQTSTRQQEMTAWGFRFEQYLCTSQPNEEPDLSSVQNTNAEFCCVVKTRLGGRSLLYGAEVDCVSKADSKPPWNSLQDFVELKTNRLIETPRHDSTFRRFKLVKWWAQCFLVGIPTIVCGYRDDDGLVTKLESFSVKELPPMGKGAWAPNVCMNFGLQFLELVRATFEGSAPAEPGVHIVFDYIPRRRTVSSRRLAAQDMNRPILPDWYTTAMASEPV